MYNEFDYENGKTNLSDLDIEELFLGNVLREPKRFRAILSDVTLTPEAFSVPRTRAVYRQILLLTHDGIVPELEQVQSRLNGECPDRYAHQLVQASDAIDLRAYAERLKDLYIWRKRNDASVKMQRAVEHRNLEEYSKARTLLEQDEVDASSYYPPERLAADFEQYLKSDGIEAFSLPYPKLNECLGGGFRRRQFTVLGGWTSHGKSVVIDEILTHIARQGKRVHLYMNEMGHEERVARLVSNDADVPLKHLMQGKLSNGQKDRVRESLKQLPYSITPCAGWSAEELTFDIRSKDYDIIGVDIIHQFDYDSESELARISRLLTRVAKQANCHVIATVHLNEFRVKDIVKPRPVPRDIRGTGMLQRDPDNIMFIHRECDPYSGDPLSSADLYLSKVRNGSLGKQEVMFNYKRMRFECV